jgi:hypothetical protein
MWLTLPRLAGALSTLPILIACGAAGRDPSVLTAPELTRSRAANAYDAIRRVRPEILRIRESGSLVYFSAANPAVALDNSLVGGVEVLRSIPTEQVARIEYLSPRQAAERYGLGFSHGLVLVTKRAGSGPKLANSSASP